MEQLASLGGPPIWKVSLLASLPLLTNGISSYFLVPASIAVGRRPVLLFCGIMAWVGGYWAGVSQSLGSHLAARCFQALGAGAVEALIPLIVQDLVFIHQRNRAMSAIWAAQVSPNNHWVFNHSDKLKGVVIIAIGVAAPIVVAKIGWRLLYFITAGLATAAWVLVVFLVPESRWIRTQGELSTESAIHSRTMNPNKSRWQINVSSTVRRVTAAPRLHPFPPSKPQHRHWYLQLRLPD